MSKSDKTTSCAPSSQDHTRHERYDIIGWLDWHNGEISEVEATADDHPDLRQKLSLEKKSEGSSSQPLHERVLYQRHMRRAKDLGA
jgi:hypothetical protein